MLIELIRNERFVYEIYICNNNNHVPTTKLIPLFNKLNVSAYRELIYSHSFSFIGQLMFEKLKSETALNRDSVVKCLSFNTIALNVSNL